MGDVCVHCILRPAHVSSTAACGVSRHLLINPSLPHIHSSWRRWQRRQRRRGRSPLNLLLPAPCGASLVSLFSPFLCRKDEFIPPLVFLVWGCLCSLHFEACTRVFHGSVRR